MRRERTVLYMFLLYLPQKRQGDFPNGSLPTYGLDGEQLNLLDQAPMPTNDERQEGYNPDILDDRPTSVPPKSRTPAPRAPSTTALHNDIDPEYGRPFAAGKEDYASGEDSPRNLSVKKPWYKTTRGIIIIVVILIVIIGAAVGGGVGGTTHKKSSSDISNNNNGSGLAPSQAPAGSDNSSSSNAVGSDSSTPTGTVHSGATVATNGGGAGGGPAVPPTNSAAPPRVRK